MLSSVAAVARWGVPNLRGWAVPSLPSSSASSLLVPALTYMTSSHLYNDDVDVGDDDKATYDVAIIGGGAAGFASTIRAWDYGKKVALIERSDLGGACIHNGALSSKTMWSLSRHDRHVRDALVSVGMSPAEFVAKETWQMVVERTKAAEKGKVDQMLSELAALASKQGRTLSKCKGTIDVISGSAQFVGTHTVEVTNKDGDKNRITAKNFVICTGSRPREIPAFPVDHKYVITSDDVTSLPDFPESILIVGAGVIGCEFATIFSNFARTKVHLLNEMKARLLPSEDEDLSNFIAHNFRNMGVSIHNQVKLMNLKVDPVKGRVEVTVGKPGPDGKLVAQPSFSVERVLFSVGRIPNVETLGLEKAGVALAAKGGGIDVDKDARSKSAPHIFAAGDVTADIGLVNVAEMEGRHCIETIFKSEHADADSTTDHSECRTAIGYENVSSIMFLRPEVACVGMNETEARRRNIPHKVAMMANNVVNRSIINRAMRPDASGHAAGFIKVIVTNDKDMKLLGMRAIGEDASALIQTVALMVNEGRGVRDIERLLHPHPAITEGVQEVCRMLLGGSIFKPHVFERGSSYIKEYTPGRGEVIRGGDGALVPTYLE